MDLPPTRPELDLRDRLAIDRTLLANERTLLAYLRTGLAIFVVGGSLLKFFVSPWAWATGAIMLATGLATIVFGALRFWQVRARMPRT